jgi:WD40 repeat protein
MRVTLILLILHICFLPSVTAQDALELAPITPDNVDDLELLGTIGRGWAVDADLSPDGSTLAIGGSTGIWIYDLETNQYGFHLSEFDRVSYPIANVLFSPDGEILAGVYCTLRNQYGLCISSAVQLWETQNYRNLLTVNATPQVLYGLAYSPDSRMLAYVADGDLHLYDLTLQREIAVFEIGYQTNNVTFSADGNRIAVASFGGIHIWSVIDRREIRHFELDSGARSVSLNSDGALVAADSNGAIHIWEVDTGNELAMNSYRKEIISDIFFSDNDRKLIYVAQDLLRGSPSEISIWELEGVSTDYTVQGQIFSIDVIANDVIAVRSFNTSLDVIEYPSQLVRLELERFFPEVQSVVFYPGSHLIAAGYADQSVRIWDIDDYSLDSVVKSNEQYFGDSIVFNKDGDLLAITEGKSILIWNVAEQQTKAKLSGHTANVYALAFTQNGRYLLSVSVDASVRVWDATTWNEVASIQNVADGRSLDASQESPRFAIGSIGVSGSGVTVRDSNTLDVISDYSMLCCVSTVALHPNGETVIIGMENGEINIVNAEQPALQISTPLSYITDIAFNSTGNLFVAVGLVLDANNYSQLPLLDEETIGVSTVAFSSDDRILVLGNGDGTIRLWGVPSDG